ncbi:MAG: HAMP domain-containing histidine kinase [Cyclobacteriaceae bacterium]|nr:HAMP domain-containing histidine kinase [Cyclobacteriaceae bacterium]
MRLLRRTVRNFIVYAALLLFVCTPLYYLAIQQLFVEEMEEELLHHKENFEKIVPKITTENDLHLYESINEEFRLKEATRWPIADSIFTIELYDSLEQEVIPFRVLRTGITLQNRNYEVIISESVVGSQDLIKAIVAIQASLLFLLLLGFILINRNLSKVIWKPFYTILEKLKQYQIDKDLSISLPKSNITEFEDLRIAIEQLLIKNREAYVSQKEFTENASHELQTPLAVFRSKLELLMQSENITSEQAELISDLLTATDRIARLNKNLLLLSKIENNQFPSKQKLLISKAVEKTIELYQGTISERKIKVSLSVDNEGVVAANPTLLEILLSNLISNSLKYSPEHSEVSISIDNKSLHLINPGEPFKNPEKIFQRFNRESRVVQGHGLGLAIVKEICDAEGFEIVYSFNSAHSFQVQF